MPHFEINPRGLLSNHLWQMDGTHVIEFKKLKYVHVTMNTYSGFLMASAQSGKATKHVITHCLKCFSYIKKPKILKTSNDSKCISKSFQCF